MERLRPDVEDQQECHDENQPIHDVVPLEVSVPNLTIRWVDFIVRIKLISEG